MLGSSRSSKVECLFFCGVGDLNGAKPAASLDLFLLTGTLDAWKKARGACA